MKHYYSGLVETIKLVAGHAMIMGNLPDKLTLSQVSNKLAVSPSQELEKFGLFDSSTPNYTTYYPEVTSDDLNPKDSEFIYPVFRMLSNTVVQHKYNPIEFPEDVLKASMGKLVGLTVNVDHETALGNGIGVIKAVEWQEAYKLNGIEIPAGINATLKIDGKSNPRLARGIMMEPPSVHSNSVTVLFTWVPSHSSLSQDEFYNKLGTYDANGKLIRKVATEIKFYTETSLVGLGADPFAQQIKNGKIVNPTLAKSREPIAKKSLSEALAGTFDVMAILDWKNKGQTIDIVENSLEEIENNNNQNNKNMDFLRLLETLFGFEANSLTEENCQEQLQTVVTKISNLETEVTGLREPTIEGVSGTAAIGDILKAHAANLALIPEGQSLQEVVNLSKLGVTALSELRADTLRLYKLSMTGKTEDENIISLINTTDFTSLKALHSQYDKLSDEQMEFTCTECGSHSVTRASAKVEEGDGGNPNQIKSTANLIESVTNKRRGSFTIFQPKK